LVPEKIMTGIPAEIIDRRLEALASENASVRNRTIAELHSLGASTADIVEALRSVMRRGEYYTSMQAAMALASFGQIAMPALIEALSSTSYGVAGHALRAIGRVSDPGAVPDLMNLVGRGLEPAVEALGQIGKSAAPAVPLLIEVVERRKEHDDREPYVLSGSPRSMAWEAAEALGRIGDARAVTCLLDMLRDDNGRSRSTAAEALGRIGDRSASEALVARLADQDDTVREKAQDALNLLGGT
jgi:HEAT repeat protein